MATSSKPTIFLTRAFDLPYLTDWFAVTLRWMCLLGLGLLLSTSGRLSLSLAEILVASVAWNIMVSVLAVFNRRFSHHRFINLFVDILTSLALFSLAPNLMWPLGWSSLLAISSTAIYFELAGSLLVGVGLGLAQTALTFFIFNPQAATYENIGVHLAGGAIAALVLGLLGKTILGNMRRNYQNQVNRRKESLQSAQKQERERVKAFYTLIETLSATLDYRVVLQSALDLSAAALGGENSPAAQMVGAVLLFEERNLVIGSGRRLPPTDLRKSFPTTQGALKKAIETGATQQVANPGQDPELGRLSALQGCQSALCLPLRRGLNAYGIMVFAHPDPDFFTAARSELLEMVSHQAVIAIQNARLYEDLATEKRRIITAQEEATRKLARDLHDGPTQSVTGIVMQISIARKLLERNSSDASDEMAKVEDLARRTVEEIRHMLFTLRPLVLESEGLTAALQTIAAKMYDLYQQNVLVEVDPAVVGQIEANTQTVIFYLVEEAVNNARKHAQAEHIWVRLGFSPKDRELALLSISDDGIGFNLNEVTNSYEKRGSLGMINLRERANLINGLLQIKSSPGQGTQIEVNIPLTPTARRSIQQLPRQ